MNLKELGGALTRRWYLTLTGALLAAALCALAYVLVPPTYESGGDVVLLPPQTTVGEGGNPYLFLGDLDQAVDILTRSLMSGETVADVEDEVPGAEFVVAPDWTTSGPILVITGRASTPLDAEAARDAVLDRLPGTLLALQDTLEVPSDAQIESMVLTQDLEPEVVATARMRAVTAAGALGLVGAALAIGLLDASLLARARRAARRQARSQTATASPGGSSHTSPSPLSEAPDVPRSIADLRHLLGAPPAPPARR